MRSGHDKGPQPLVLLALSDQETVRNVVKPAVDCCSLKRHLGALVVVPQEGLHLILSPSKPFEPN